MHQSLAHVSNRLVSRDVKMRSLLLSEANINKNWASRHKLYKEITSDRKPGVGFPGAPGGPDPGAGVGPGDCTSQNPGAGGFLLSKPRGFRGVF